MADPAKCFGAADDLGLVERALARSEPFRPHHERRGPSTVIDSPCDPLVATAEEGFRHPIIRQGTEAYAGSGAQGRGASGFVTVYSCTPPIL